MGEVFIRSRILYGVQAWTLTELQKQKISSVWNNLLRRMIKGGFRRVPDQTTPKTNLNLEKANKIEKSTFKYVITNEMLYRITGTSNITNFIDRQFLKFTSHVVRMANHR